VNIGDFELAYSMRTSGDIDSPVIVFLHGFGSSKEYFRHAFTDPSLTDFSLIAFDLPGSGLSSGDPDFSYGMSDQAALMIRAIDKLAVPRFHLCTHSMGGLVGIEMVERIAPRIISFVNLEGNLTLEDCTMTGLIAEYSYESFLRNGRKEFEESLEKGATADPILQSYLRTFRQASSVALHRSAQHAVRDSSNPGLVDRFRSLQTCKCYIYGEKNKGLFPAEKMLVEGGVPVLYVESAGHGMAEENPQYLYSLIREFIGSCA
jgi:pimeloyl-ACP methyl ester carboxylesterase